MCSPIGRSGGCSCWGGRRVVAAAVAADMKSQRWLPNVGDLRRGSQLRLETSFASEANDTDLAWFTEDSLG